MTTTTIRPRRDSGPQTPRRRPGYRRARTLLGTVGLTTLGTLLPGAGILWTGRRLLGLLVLVPSLALATAGVWSVGRDLDTALDFAFDPVRLKVAAVVLGVALVLWSVVVVTTYALVRPRARRRGETLAGSAFVAVLCLLLALPLALTSRYATVQADLVEKVFVDIDHHVSATDPDDVTVEDPWAGRDRVNLLLLGGDGDVHREGVRTDSMILVSMDTGTGRTTMLSLPRNLMNARFPPATPLRTLYPRGFRGPGDPGEWMLNAVYRNVPALHPGAMGETSNEGADAVKQAVAGSLGVPVDYYLLVNLQGFRQIVNAMGGVTVNINEPIAVGGNTDLGVPPDRYLKPGPDQRLQGYDALWYSRGRYGSDDYERMERQRCMIDALIDEARPLNLIRRYQTLASTGKRIVRTDVPRDLLPAFVNLTLEVKDSSVSSVVFRSSGRFDPADPDFGWMRRVTSKALSEPAPPKRRESSSGDSGDSGASADAGPDSSSTPRDPGPGQAVEATDSCAYAPTTG